MSWFSMSPIYSSEMTNYFSKIALILTVRVSEDSQVPFFIVFLNPDKHINNCLIFMSKSARKDDISTNQFS